MWVLAYMLALISYSEIGFIDYLAILIDESFLILVRKIWKHAV